MLQALKEAKVVIFDFDGTIVKLNVDWSELKERLISYFRERYCYVSTFTPLFRELEKISHIIGEQAKQEAVRIIEKYEEQASYVPNLKIITLIKVLANSGERLCIFSSNGRSIIERVLSQLNLRDIFDIIISRDDIKHYKPSPEGLLKILTETGFSSNETVMIGNSLTDFEACRSAGVRMLQVDIIL